MGGKLVNGKRVSAKSAMDVVTKVKEVIGGDGVYVAGSLRRGKAEVGDIDLIVVRDEAVKDLNWRLQTLTGIDLVKRKSCSFVFEGMQIDLNLCSRDIKGSYLLHWTGSSKENVRLRRAAKKRGLKLSQNGLVDMNGNNLSAGKSESEIYGLLDLSYVKPEDR